MQQSRLWQSNYSFMVVLQDRIRNFFVSYCMQNRILLICCCFLFLLISFAHSMDYCELKFASSYPVVWSYCGACVCVCACCIACRSRKTATSWFYFMFNLSPSPFSGCLWAPPPFLAACEPLPLSLLHVVHRLAAAESTQHEVKCAVCKTTPIRGFRYAIMISVKITETRYPLWPHLR